MPLYEYRCDACGRQFELIRKFSDPPLETCPTCGGLVHKLVSSPAFQFKGTGWYITDYAKKDHAGPGGSSSSDGTSDAASKDGASGDGGGDKTAEKSGAAAKGDTTEKKESKGESRSESKGESKSDSKSEGKKGRDAAPAASSGTPGSKT